eukprot:scaffold86_cov338-Pavlova_lutheri.AAC.48
MKLDPSALRYLSKDDFRVLTAVELGQRNVRERNGTRTCVIGEERCARQPSTDPNGKTKHARVWCHDDDDDDDDDVCSTKSCRPCWWSESPT